MEWLRDTQWLGWVGVALVLGLIEIASLDFIFTMLAVAALAAAASAGLGFDFPVQAIVFVLTSLVLLAGLRPLLLRRLKMNGPGVATGTEAGVGQQAEVLRAVTDRGGLVKLRGEEWSARAATVGEALEPGLIVQVVRIEGATAIVTRPATD